MSRRILLTTYEFAPFRGGIGRVAEGLAEGAAALGAEPIVLAPDYGEDQGPHDALRNYAIRRFDGAFCSIVSPRRLLRFAAICRHAIAATRPDLVHGVDPPAQMALAVLSRFGLVPRHVLTVHGTELLRYRAETLPRLWMRNGFARADAVCAVSRHVLDTLLAGFRIDPGRAFTSHPGIAPAWHDSPPTDRAVTRRLWKVNDGDVVVLTVARVVAEKGQDRVIAALARLPEALRARFLYVVAGTGPDPFARQLDEAAVAGGVRLLRTGAVPDAELIRLYDAADLFIMLSRQTPKRLEGLGLTYIEAGSRGLPSIACDTGGVPEAVLDGSTGVLLPGNCPAEDIATVLARLGADPPERTRLGFGARAHARAFTYANHAREVYERAGLLG